MNKKQTTVTNIETALAEWKSQDEELRRRRGELMFRLYAAGIKTTRIAEIYGCTRQFVQQELKQYQTRRTTNRKVTAIAA